MSVYSIMAKSSLGLIPLLEFYNVNPVLFYIIIILVIGLIQIVYVFLTPFERKIKVTEKFEYASGKYMRNTLQDSEGRVYQVTTSWPILHFKATETWLQMHKDKEYIIRGNGIRIPILGLFPNIVGATNA